MRTGPSIAALFFGALLMLIAFSFWAAGNTATPDAAAPERDAESLPALLIEQRAIIEQIDDDRRAINEALRGIYADPRD